MFQVVFWLLMVVTALLGVLVTWIRLRNRTIQRGIADQAPSSTALSILLVAFAFSLFARRRFGAGFVVSASGALYGTLAVYGWWLRHKIDDKWQPDY